MMTHDVFSDLLEIFSDVGKQTFWRGMLALDLLEDFGRRFVGIDFFCRFGKRSLLCLQLPHADLENFFRRKIDKFSFSEQALKFFGAKGEVMRRLWKFFALQPRGIIGESIRCSAIGILKRGANLLVF